MNTAVVISRQLCPLSNRMFRCFVLCILVQFITVPAQERPDKCQCQGTYIYCQSRQLTSVPSNISGTTTYLDLQENPLKTIPANTFSTLTNLRTLWLKKTELSELLVGAFEGLSSLTFLVLGDNNLLTLPVGFFKGLMKLEILDLARNKFRSLPSTFIHGLINLKNLYLQGNQLTTLEKTFFCGINNLERLLLNYNKLRSLPVGIFEGVVKLNRLDLSFNELPSLPFTLFHSLLNLRYLNLQTNLMTKVDSRLLCRLNNVTFLHLDGNPTNCCSSVGFLNFIRNMPRGRRVLLTCRDFNEITPSTEFNITRCPLGGQDEVDDTNPCAGVTIEIDDPCIPKNQSEDKTCEEVHGICIPSPFYCTTKLSNNCEDDDRVCCKIDKNDDAGKYNKGPFFPKCKSKRFGKKWNYISPWAKQTLAKQRAVKKEKAQESFPDKRFMR